MRHLTTHPGRHSAATGRTYTDSVDDCDIRSSTKYSPCIFGFEVLCAKSSSVTGLIPSASVTAPSKLIPSQSQGFGLIPSQAPPADPSPSTLVVQDPSLSGLLPLSSSPITVDPEPSASNLIPSGSILPGPTPSNLIPPTIVTLSPISTASNINIIPSVPPYPTTGNPQYPPNATSHGSMASTNEGLKPIPAPTNAPGDPNGHNEISEPNFSATRPCHGCSPVVEIPKTGFFDMPTTAIADHHETTHLPQSPVPLKATITAGPSEVVISKESAGNNWIIGELTTVLEGFPTVVDPTTVAPGQIVMIDHTPVVIQTSNGGTEVVIGTATVPIPQQPESHDSPYAQITPPPILAPVVLGSQTLTANTLSQYLVSDQTLAPGGPAITVDGTIISLAPSAMALIIDGVTTTLIQSFHGHVYTSTIPGLLTFNNQVFTAMRGSGYYVISPGITLIPGGPPVTVSNTVISLQPQGTAVVIHGTTSQMAPATTVVTLTRGDMLGGNSYSGLPYSTSQLGSMSKLPPVSAGKIVTVGGGMLESLWLLGVLGFGWLAIWL
ncbi:hypothetical protein K504DRAFT_456408 [Pleomassaria siparia CBS 279.74]|uniref:Uncharacterized protein n=1 Tax=Pleomassaria siparia CBS 279.74 TaxID=1314801 RepID=A0A6G1K6F9_9PLEO|nr:hypothetical protein K504DRAFT_456408 [Pleomassaria siparia CBS 279.74]